eukprot:8926230-Heterocapsa_arctica.AAC.1
MRSARNTIPESSLGDGSRKFATTSPFRQNSIGPPVKPPGTPSLNGHAATYGTYSAKTAPDSTASWQESNPVPCF